ncbi:hypothetical protein HHK36_031772 [Tetracentron sinense]|uniref:Uncharacterized protein n=2 Tax=Tetracentron sinense TaxID=13715 RepID=A0A834Y8K0_TETSI|nr:hypothetical protein HHK36_031772 [Tetracentron sinense]
MVRRLEAEEMSLKQAKGIIYVITEVFMEIVAQSFVSKDETQKIGMILESKMSKFKSKVESSQECHFPLLQRETEKLGSDIEKTRSELQHETEKFRSNIEKTHSELRYEIDKATVGLRLDWNDDINKLDRICILMRERHFSLLQRDTEKLRSDIEKMCSKLRYEIDRVTAGQCLDLNNDIDKLDWVNLVFASK